MIVLNWHASADTIRCLQQVAGWQCLQPTVWVVDNGSPDDSVDTISQECPYARIIRSSSNLGFGGGNNKGITEALARSAVPILLLNNDASIAEEDVLRLLKTLGSDPKIGFVGPLLFDTDEKEHLLAAGGRNPVQHHHSHILEVPSGRLVRQVGYVPGTVLLVRAEVFRTVGLFDERYFFTMEVADLCMRAREQGYLSVIDARARALHDLSRSSDLRETLHAYYIIRNRFLFINKFHANRRACLCCFWAVYSVALMLKVWSTGRPMAARAIWAGLLDGMRGRFGGQNKRVLVLQRQNPRS